MNHKTCRLRCSRKQQLPGNAVQQGAASEIWTAMLAELRSLRAAVERLEEQQKLLAAPDPGKPTKPTKATPAPDPSVKPNSHPFADEMAALRAKQHKK